MVNKVKLIPRNVAEEYEKNLIAAAGSEKKVAAARQLVSSRLMTRFGIQWWSNNSASVRDEMQAIEQDLSTRCGTCGARLSEEVQE